ncbi:hypothetical protein FIBSPDRAFT_853510 [Athelia psychrophila]|uniref:Uncharacterized protein n=1 Tax=Athelia psychrophila TaxID=1759441 RepID=A0A166QWT0_9AGAM|nr:hypothetical protein FIBSPDRAFT_853510 [Fibularhizoctonia sp. CBS 109695]
MHPFTNWSIQPPARPRALKQIIQTLDPSRLRPSDYLNPAGAGQPMISIQNTCFMPSYTSQPGRNPLYHSARGFLYLRGKCPMGHNHRWARHMATLISVILPRGH